jgi:hypothetical protein
MKQEQAQFGIIKACPNVKAGQAQQERISPKKLKIGIRRQPT